MKSLIGYLVVLLFCCYTGFGTAQKTPAELGVGAIGLVVSDIEKSEYFYKDLMGMVPSGGFSLDEQWSKEAGAANDKPFSVKIFKMVSGESATMLKLAYFDSVVGSRPDQTGVDTNAGVNYITFYYSKTGFQEVMERFKKADIPPLGWVKRENYQLAFFRDPDGVFVELIGPPED